MTTVVRCEPVRRGIPPDVAEDLGVARRERVLAWGRLVGGGLVAATLGGIRIRTPRGGLLERTWVDVDRAEWHAESGTLVIWWVGERQVTPLELEPQASTRVPVAVRERVQASVLLTGEVEVGGGRKVRVALRRTADGALVTQALPPPGVAVTDPEVAAAVRRARTALQAEAGAEEEPHTGFDNLHDA
jgi:hypothetical protein